MAATIRPWLRRHAALLTLGACISLGGWLHPEPLEQLDLAYTDQVQRWGGTSAPPADITIVAVDAYSLQQAANVDLSSQDELQDLKHWPWPRRLHGLVLTRLIEAGAKVVGFDLLFDTPSVHGPNDDLAFARSLGQHRKQVVLGMQVLNSQGPVAGLSLQPLHPVLVPSGQAPGLGLLNGQPDADGVLRQRPGDAANRLRRMLGTDVPQGFAVALLQQAGVQQPDSSTSSEVLLKLYGPPRTIRTIPIWNLLDNTSYAALKASNTLNDQWVLIGPTAALFQDLHQTALGGAEEMPGVEIHATELANRLEGRGLRAASLPSGWHLLLGIGVILIGLQLERWERPLVRIGVTTGLSSLIGLAGFLSIQLTDQAIPAASMMASIVALGLVSSGDATMRLQWQRRKLRRDLARYLSPAVAAEIAQQPDNAEALLGGRELNVVVLMSDIRGFTAFTQGMTRQGKVRELVERLNQYFGDVVDVIHSEGGTVDKFIGDAVLAVFGAPLQRSGSENALAAIRAALAMQQRLAQLNAHWRADGQPTWDQVIALSDGWVISGNIGSENRMDYTVIGDAVNTASRLESIAKQCNQTIVVSEGMASQLPEDIPLQNLGSFDIRGQGQQRVFALKTAQNSN